MRTIQQALDCIGVLRAEYGLAMTLLAALLGCHTPSDQHTNESVNPARIGAARSERATATAGSVDSQSGSAVGAPSGTAGMHVADGGNAADRDASPPAR